MFNKKKNIEDPSELCENEMLIEDIEGKLMPTFKGDQIYSRTFEIPLQDLCEDGYILMPATFERKYNKNKRSLLIEGGFQMTI